MRCTGRVCRRQLGRLLGCMYSCWRAAELLMSEPQHVQLAAFTPSCLKFSMHHHSI